MLFRSEVGIERHGFGKGVVAVAGDEQVVFLAAKLRIAAWDSSLAFDDKQLSILSTLIDKGYRWVIWKGMMDVNV